MMPPAIPGRIWGVDTSVAQGPPTYLATLRDYGCSFHFARAHSGSAEDGVYRATAAEAERLEVPFGAYGVVRHRRRLAGEGDATVIANAGAYGETQASALLLALTGTRRDLPEVVDWELPANPTTMTRAEAAGNIRSARIYRDIIAAETGRTPLVYCGFGFVDVVANLAGDDGAEDLASLAESPLFVAHYTQSALKLPTVPRAWAAKGWRLWQGSGDKAICRNACQIPGTTRDIDVDWFRGTVAELIAPDLRQRGAPTAQVSG